jgi:plastocyanin
MSKNVKRGSLGLLFAALAVLGAFAIASSTAASRPAPREIVLVAEGMAFHLLGGAGETASPAVPNPTLSLERGETVRVVLVNRDPGMEHDWAADGLDAATRVVPGDGSVASVLLTAPEAPGRHEYVCSLHARMMRGTIEVR